MYSAKICGIEFSPPMMNASGVRCTTEEELTALGKSSSGAIVMKSGTFEPRDGYPEPNLYDWHKNCVQAMGLPNPGYKELAGYIPELKKYNKPVIASVYGFNKEENIIMSQAFEKAGADMVEQNLACPNAGNKILCYHLDEMADLLREVKEAVDIPVSAKLGAYVDPMLLEEAADAVEYADCLVLINSIPGAVAINDRTYEEILTAGYGGLSGESIKPIALGNVKRFYEMTKKDIIGVGGVFSGNDVMKYFSVGAKGVQIGTAFYEEGIEIFDNIIKELLW